MSTISIEEQIEQAKAAAAAHTANQGTAVAVATAPTTGTAVAMPGMPQAGKRLSDEDMMIGGVSVDIWFKPKQFGIQFGKENELVPSFEGVLDLREKALNFAIKFGNNPAIYLKSYDGATCASGGTWEQAIARAKAVEPNARPYNSVDLPITLTKDVLGPQSNKVLAKAGQKAGYATSTTNWSKWESFYNACKAAGFDPKNPDPDKSRAKVKVGYEGREKGSNTWGIATFEFLGWEEEVETGE